MSNGLAGVFLARHGETDYNAGGRFQGLLAVPLNETGRAQAGELAERAAGYDFRKLWTSPLLRARQTAEIVAQRIELEPVEDARLVETDTGDWTDRWFSEMDAEHPEEMAAFRRGDASFAFPGGESYVQQTVRVMAALHEIAADVLPALVVCHAMVIRLALAHEGRPLDRVGNATLVEL